MTYSLLINSTFHEKRRSGPWLGQQAQKTAVCHFYFFFQCCEIYEPSYFVVPLGYSEVVQFSKYCDKF